MKLLIQNRDLKHALKKLGTVINQKAFLEVLRNIHVKAVDQKAVFTVSDTEVILSIEVPLSESIKEIETLIPFTWIKGISDLHADELLVLDLNKTIAHVKAFSAEYTQSSLVALKELPPVFPLPVENSVDMSGGFITWMNRAQLTCDFKNEIDIWISKVYLELVENIMIITSTNRSTLFTHTFNIQNSANMAVMVSAKIIKALDGFTNTKLFWNDDLFAFSSEGVTVIAKRPEGQFPQYNAVIPKDPTINLVANRVQLKEILEKVCFVNPSEATILFSKEKIQIVVENEHAQKAEFEYLLDNEFTGSIESMLVNPTHLKNILNQHDYEKIGVGVTEPFKPMFINNSTDLSYIGLLMPLSKK